MTYTDYKATCEHGDDTVTFAEEDDNRHEAAWATARAEMECAFTLYRHNGSRFVRVGESE